MCERLEDKLSRGIYYAKCYWGVGVQEWPFWENIKNEVVERKIVRTGENCIKNGNMSEFFLLHAP